ncbi:MAG: DNA repair protein RecO [Limnobacter sp.]|uniref:DNA repair protein RecO n=1 Tax=Limnobacter sp. TaxID=2003368 RepID=UPI00391AF9C7
MALQGADTAFVLHSVPYKETSLIVELFCREHGRLPVVAKGAKRPHSALRSVLVSFQPLQVRFSGRGEVKTLTHAEWLGGMLPPVDKALFSAYYLNELLMRGLSREDSHEGLFDVYSNTLANLCQGVDVTVCVRTFEIELLRELGFGLDWESDAQGQPISAESDYVWFNERGWTPTNGLSVHEQQALVVEQAVPGQVIVNAGQHGVGKTEALALKPVTRKLLNAHVAPNGLLARNWMEQLLKS